MKETSSDKSLKTKNRDSRTTKSGSPKKEYKKPELIHYGKIKDLTLGGSPGQFDTGNVDAEQPQ